MALTAVAGPSINGKDYCQHCGNQVEWLTGTPAPLHVATQQAACKNVSRREIRLYSETKGMSDADARAYAQEHAYETWQSPDGSWTFYVLAKRQVDDHKQYAIWLCAVVSPYETDMAGHDTYAADVRSTCQRIA